MKNDVPTPILTMRVYPEGGSLYARVRVYSTRREMHTAIVNDHWSVSRKAQGLVAGITRGRGKRTYPQFAEVFLWRGRLGMEVLTHESYHVLVSYAERRGWKLGKNDTDLDERGAYAIGRVARQIVKRLYDEKILA